MLTLTIVIFVIVIVTVYLLGMPESKVELYDNSTTGNSRMDRG